MSWVRACATSDLDEHPVIRFDTASGTFAIYRSPEGEYFATDGHCTHEQTHLADGNVYGHEIECPRHLGAFDYRTGEAVLAPACIGLRTYPVRQEGNEIMIDI